MSYHHGNLKESLIQAGDNELKENGIEHLSLREIAKRAGVSHNAPYRHFNDKADLIDQIIKRTLAEIAEQIQAAPLLYPVSLQMQIQYVGRIWALLAARHPRKAHLLFTGLSQSESHKTIIKAGHELVRLNLQSLLDAALGADLQSQTNTQQLSLVFLAMFRGLGVLYTSQTMSDLLPSEDEFYDLFDASVENILRSVLV